jgi:dynein heavy chain
MERGLVPNALVPRLRASIDEHRGLLPVVVAMRNAALKDRHWSKINAVVGIVFLRDATFTLQVGLARSMPW